MKKLLQALLFLIPCCASLQGEGYDCYQQGAPYGYSYPQGEICCYQPEICCEDSSCCGPVCGRLGAEFKFAAFYPLDNRVRKLYKKFWASYEIELSTTFCNCWQVWFDAGYLSSHGRTRCFDSKTRLYMIPLSLGVSYLRTLECQPCVDVYVGAGVAYTLIRMRDHSPFVNPHVSDKGFGAVVKTGFYYHLNECFYLEGFFNYLYQRFSFSRDCSPTGFVERHDANMSGLKLGFGIGSNF